MYKRTIALYHVKSLLHLRINFYAILVQYTTLRMHTIYMNMNMNAYDIVFTNISIMNFCIDG